MPVGTIQQNCSFALLCIYLIMLAIWADVHVNDEEYEPRNDGKHE